MMDGPRITKNQSNRMAKDILAPFQARSQKLTARLSEKIRELGYPPKVRIFWNSRAEDLDFEVLK